MDKDELREVVEAVENLTAKQITLEILKMAVMLEAAEYPHRKDASRFSSREDRIANKFDELWRVWRRV